MVQQAIDRWGRIDIVVNVAGILRDRMIFNMTEEEWDAVIAVHLKGTYNTMRAASVSMRQQQYGRFINMSSVSALGAPGQPNYAAAKAGIIGLTWSTANAMAKYNVTANTIMPSGATRMIDSTPRGREVFEQTGKWPSEQAVGTERDPDNVAPLVVYLASEAAAHVNGQVFHSFGYGYTLLAQPQAVRRLVADRRLDPERAGPAVLPRPSGPTSSRRPPWVSGGPCTSGRPANGRSSAEGVRFWQWPREDGGGGSRTVSRDVFVCHANTCRSVMAHVLLEQMLRERAVNGAVRVRSAGVGNVRARRHDPVPRRPPRPPRGGIHLDEDTITSTDLRRHRYLVSGGRSDPDHDGVAKRDAWRPRGSGRPPALHAPRVCRGHRRHRGPGAAGRGEVPRLPRRDPRLPRALARPPAGGPGKRQPKERQRPRVRPSRSSSGMRPVMRSATMRAVPQAMVQPM